MFPISAYFVTLEKYWGWAWWVLTLEGKKGILQELSGSYSNFNFRCTTKTSIIQCMACHLFPPPLVCPCIFWNSTLQSVATTTTIKIFVYTTFRIIPHSAL
jgi:hypothetical protein